MVVSLVLAATWVFCASAVAVLPLRAQRLPGGVLVLAAPVLIWLLFRDFGSVAAGFGLFALLSMFRRPVLHAVSRLWSRSATEEPQP
ncbi:MAG: UDP-N-acetylmuramate--alanine ligase [Alphaproteobacteria bacterium MedPE-SWcel]|nr:MAG: UDP-N-acetylmuramate--alanine ligase [Alphaproteobacteria bacterium MedPE-SWcel]